MCLVCVCVLIPKFDFKGFDKGVCEDVQKSEKEMDQEKEKSDKRARKRIGMKMTQTWPFSNPIYNNITNMTNSH